MKEDSSSNFILDPNLDKDNEPKEVLSVDDKSDSGCDSRNEFSEDDASNLSARSMSLDENNKKSITFPDMNKNLKRGDEEVSRSTGSAGSSASTNSLANLHNRIQAFSKANEQRTLGAGLRKLQYALLFSMILLTLTSILKFVLVTNSLFQISSEIDDVYNIGWCSRLIGKISYNIQLITYSPSTLFHFNGFFSDSESQYIKDNLILPDVTQMEVLVDKFFIQSSSTFSSSLKSLSFTPNIPLIFQRNVNGNLYLETVELRLFDACKIFLQKARVIQGQSFDSIFDFIDPTFFVLKNGLSTIHPKLIEAVNLRAEQATLRVTDVRVVALTLTIISIVLMFVVLLVVIKPIVWAIDDNRQSILVLFTEIPQNFLLTFKHKCEERLTRLSRARDEFLNAGFSIDDGIDESNFNESIEEQAAQPLLNSDGKAQTSAKEVKEKASSSKISYKEELFGNRHMTLLKIASILALSTLYFGITYYVEYISLETNLKSISNNIAYGELRGVERYSSLFYLRKYLLQQYTISFLNGSPNIDYVTSDFVSEKINHLELIQGYMAYGNSELNILPPSGEQLFAYFGDSCESRGSYTPYPGCSDFHQQIMAHGFHLAVMAGIDLMRKVLQTVSVLNMTNFAQLNATVNSDEMITLRKLNENYLPPLGEFSNKQYSIDLEDSIQNAYSVRLILLIIFLFGSYCLYLVYYNPLLWILNNEQKRTITLLFMIPAAVYELKILSIYTLEWKKWLLCVLLLNN